ncbi:MULTISPECIES: transcriptional regulator [unclassified Breznakia]|uniref:transcriptional regulator n=1 Tax=unclassified Breznakia TaxID=2623764 RepID=UPI0024770D2D|nr:MULTISPECIES: transcriptional regulator [unclassified Breznakia]MDH6365996.1 DNA-binding MarR family transcriptional regulator [Breznakia sp. PH1-1]MDH6403072.1 DNA-binding MarR family transcriptional regulator [Breznakia sp. PF1-11]MDH6410781.1 DNA-binding MarR family transcriptional regulator [Breznakia sp. PFB1-11]MDH6413162.1 DNA-binding MarR family transcriptional regulator [Breznakia sp. PFB1-14]MDH6415530.1 DNA-binding MarR family transcriptional regulator [Breznakia sp. PFB1-4]
MSTKLLQTSKVFESNIRLQMIASLSVSDLTYRELKDICECSDGNMTTHTKKLVENDYISVKKEFINNKPQTTYSLTKKGRREFLEYVNILNSLTTGSK